MKKIVIILAVALAGLTVCAQEGRRGGKGPGKPDPEMMAQMQTKAMAERYALTPEQQAYVLELNRQYAGRIPMPSFARPERRERPEFKEDQRPEFKEDQRPGFPGGEGLSKEQQKQRKADQKAYKKSLKKILNKEQFKAYKNDLKEAEEQAQQFPGPRPGGPGRGFGPGPGGFGGFED